MARVHGCVELTASKLSRCRPLEPEHFWKRMRSATYALNILERVRMLPNNMFETNRGASFPLRARNGLRARRCGDASWPAAQQDR
jgi:hypothetical protein